MRRQRVHAGWMSATIAVLLCALGAAGTIPSARAAEVLDAHTVSMEAWARPTVPGQPIDVATMMLGDDVREVLTIMVVRDAYGETPTASDLARFCTEVAGSYFPAQRTVAENAVALPADLAGSRGYWGKERWGSSVLVCSLQDDAVEVFALLSTDTDAARTQALVTAVARAALTVEPPPIAAPAVDIVAREFGRERSLTDLPGSAAIPADFQVVARDYQVRSS